MHSPRLNPFHDAAYAVVYYHPFSLEDLTSSFSPVVILTVAGSPHHLRFFPCDVFLVRVISIPYFSSSSIYHLAAHSVTCLRTLHKPSQ